MSVDTKADECKNKAVEHIKKAIQNLDEIVVQQCWGYDEFKGAYETALREAFYDLIKLRDMLEG